MSSKKLFALLFVAALGLAAVSRFAIADAAKEAKAPASPADLKLPPGWTMEDMQACIVAATPGKMQQHLAKEAGTWKGKTTMYMPGAEPQTSECVSTVTPMMEGRFIKVEMKGEMPGMGPYEGFGLYGYDNTAKKFASTWIDNQTTSLLQGTGELSADGKVMTWKYTFTCPITKKADTMREVETVTGENTKTLEVFCPDPKTGKEMKMMTIELTRS